MTWMEEKRDAIVLAALEGRGDEALGLMQVFALAIDARGCACNGETIEYHTPGCFASLPFRMTQRAIDIVFATDGPVSELVEVEAPPGTSIQIGRWVESPGGFIALRITAGEIEASGFLAAKQIEEQS